MATVNSLDQLTYSSIADIGGTVYLGSVRDAAGSATRLWSLSDMTRRRLVTLAGRNLFEVSWEAAAVAHPTDAGEVLWVEDLHPGGYALALVRDGALSGHRQLWQCMAGIWTVKARTVSVGMEANQTFSFATAPPLRIVTVGDKVYILPTREPAAYVGLHLVGSSLVALPAYGSEDMPAEAASYLAGIAATSSSPFDRPPGLARWRGRWYAGLTAALQRDVPGTDDFEEFLNFNTAAQAAALGGELRSLHLFRDHWAALVALDPADLVYDADKRAQWVQVTDAKAYTARFDDWDLASGLLVRPYAVGEGVKDRLWLLGLGYPVSEAYSGHYYVDYTAEVARQKVYLVAGGGVEVFEATLEWAVQRTSPEIGEASLEWSEASGVTSPAVSEAALEWGEKTGNTTPVISAATLEWQALNRPTIESATLEWRGANRSVPQITEAVLEWSRRTGTNSPVVDSATLESSEATGNTSPVVTSAELHWAQPAQISPAVEEAALEWAGHAEPDPLTEGVLFATHTDPDGKVATAIRATTDLPPADEAELRGIVRADKETIDADAWASYQEFALGQDVYLEEPGNEVRVGIIGPLVDDPPDLSVQIQRPPE